MDKSDIYTQVAEMEEQLGRLYREVKILKQHVVALLEENKSLSLENQNLRDMMANKEQENQKKEENGQRNHVVGEGYDNLARLYYEGFHICHVHYGSLRTEGDCLFCLSFLNK
ncbi:DNA replication initiation control protein YabA [Microaerobacter geothermalis]|uniref:DNA replication initiation control protein YabA n=1 Tax=Microaerobacter geothermalis TaxID=674972 RepID=UPI001F2771D9|nr:DNA replication initiation control protein YabA [Microaerobacter geothermalis]MCF6095146.1 DNA replication initiation control protein YabA [Microaerobacter geothermalis]